MRPSLAVLGACALLSACTQSILDAFVQQPSAESRVLMENASYPEGPLWWRGELYATEMRADRVVVFRGPAQEPQTYWRQEGCGPTAVAPYGDGLLVLCHLTGRIVALDADRNVRFTRDRTVEGHRFRDPNDASADAAGGVYFSDPGPFYRDMRPGGAVIYLDAEGEAHRVLAGLWYPNGVLVDPVRQQLYVSETFSHRVLRYAIAPDHTLSFIDAFDAGQLAPPPRPGLAPYDDWGPDGLDFGPSGDLFIALYGQARVIVASRNFAYRGALQLAPQYVTNLTFGPSGELYTTGAFDNVRPPSPGEIRRWDRLPGLVEPAPSP